MVKEELIKKSYNNTREHGSNITITMENDDNKSSPDTMTIVSTIDEETLAVVRKY